MKLQDAIENKTAEVWFCNVHNAELAVEHYGIVWECAASLRSVGRIDECVFVITEGAE